jgi:hypothetical protein
MTTYTIKGTTQDYTTCDCCGRDNLKKTVILIPHSNGESHSDAEVYFGVDCAARALGKSESGTRNKAENIERARQQRVCENTKGFTASVLFRVRDIMNNGYCTEMNIDRVRRITDKIVRDAEADQCEIVRQVAAEVGLI